MRDLTIVFDLDGTLIDTAPDLIHATNHVIVGEGLDPMPAEALRPWISHGARRLIEVGLAARGQNRTSAEVDVLLDRFLGYYEANIAVESRPFDGLLKVLDTAAAAGARLAVCTNKREYLSRMLLDQLALSPRFAALAGRDTFSVCKPHPDHLFGTIRLAGGDPARAVMVGDSDVDVATAKAARIPVIAVTFGYTSIPISELAADAVIDHYDAFLPALARITG
jgi:phosphoglycolate phosphatase